MTARALVVLMVLGSLCAPGGTEAQGEMRQREQVALGFVESLRAGDEEATLDYIETNFADSLLERRPMDQWRGLVQQLSRHAGLEVVGLDVTEDQVLVEATTPDGMGLELGFDFVSDAPGKIAGLSISAGGAHGRRSSLPPLEVPEGAGRDTVHDALGRWFDALDDAGEFSGAALVAWDGEPLFRGAWGLASREWQVPNGVDTRFALGSINKSFTKIAIAQLAEAGKLSLDDTIADHLPDYPDPDAARKVTIRQLVSHTSGLGDIFTERYFGSSKLLYREPSDYFPIFAGEPLLFEPGEGRAYSNAGYMVLGAIIAAVSGRSYSEYVQESIFEPAGMTEIGFFARDEIHPRVAVGYTRRSPHADGELRNNLLMLSVRGSSAGNAYATVDDMLRFDEAVREHALLPPEWTHWYFGGDEPGDQDPPRTSRERAMSGIGIAGGAPGVSAVVESDGRLTLIVLSNEDEPGAEDVARALRRPLVQTLRPTD